MVVALMPKVKKKVDTARWQGRGRKMDGANFTSTRRQNASMNKLVGGLWKRAWNCEAARNIE